MTREQAINYLICRGITEYQVSEIVRALTYKPRDCANCKHYIVKDTRTNWGSQETTKIYGCERWECEYEPTTKNNLGVDCISREKALVAIRNLYPSMPRVDFNGSLRKWVDKYKPYIECEDAIKQLPSVTPQEPKSEWEQDHAILKAYSDGANEVLDKIYADIQKLRGCSCGCSDGIIDDVEDIIDKYKGESDKA